MGGSKLKLGAAAAVALLVASSATAFGGETIIDSFDSVAAWTESAGSTCAATSGAVTSGAGYSGNGALLSYDFTKVTKTPNFYTGCSVLMTRSFSPALAPPAGIGFWVLSPPDAMVNLDVEDQSGQWLTYHVSRPLDALDPTQWYQQVVELDAPSAWDGGANNGVIQTSIQAIALEVQNRQSYLTGGTIAFDELGTFDSLGGELDPFATLVPAPAGSSDLESTFSVNITTNVADIPPMADAGFRFIRSACKWSSTEVTMGVYDFSVQDGIQAELEQSGMKATWILGGGNPLYGDCGPNPDGGQPINGCAPSSPNSLQHFQTWAAAVATHFHGTGDRFEAFNEPGSHNTEFANSNGTAYAPIVNTVIAGIHQGDPDAGITCGGLASPGSGTPVWPGTFDWSFFENYLDAGGGLGANAVAFHPYRLEAPETVTDDLVLARAILGSYLSPAPEIWNTEWGYDVADDADAGTQGAQTWQAVNDLRLLLAPRAMGFGYSSCFSADAPGWGILTLGLVYDPASVAVEIFSERVAGRTFAGFIPAVPTSLEALRFDGTADVVVVLWSAATGPNLQVSLPGPATAAADMLGNALPFATDGGGLLFQIAEAAGPVYVTLPWPAGMDGGTDEGAIDAGGLVADGGSGDAGSSDAGGADSGTTRDAGLPDGGAGAGPDGGRLDGGSVAAAPSGCGCGTGGRGVPGLGLAALLLWVRSRRPRYLGGSTAINLPPSESATNALP